MKFTARLCFESPKITLVKSVQLDNEPRLFDECVKLIRATPVPPKLTNKRLIVMAVFVGDWIDDERWEEYIDANLTAYLQTSLYDWMIAEGLLEPDTSDFALTERPMFVHGTEWSTNQRHGKDREKVEQL